MSTKQNQTKSKLSEVAKDLKISNQELSDFISNKFGTVKKPSASITQDELNYILESFSQNNQVDSFNPYFESRNNKPEPKKEEKPADKKPAPAKKQESLPQRRIPLPRLPRKQLPRLQSPHSLFRLQSLLLPRLNQRQKSLLRRSPRHPRAIITITKRCLFTRASRGLRLKDSTIR